MRKLWLAMIVLLAVSAASAQTYKVLYNFGVGVGPPGLSMAQGRDGDLYSTTCYGGVWAGGTAFRITPAGQLTVLHSFRGPEGALPVGGLALSSDGDFYGTTTTIQSIGYSLGSIFKMNAAGGISTLHLFPGGLDGSDPRTVPLQAMDGNFYGTTEYGGASQDGGYGIVYKMGSTAGAAKLHGFAPPGLPVSPLVEGTDGKLYGVSLNLIFTITELGEFQKLFDFNLNPEDGLDPDNTPLVEGSDGIFYGTTYAGGSDNAGVIFKITRGGQLTVLHNFLGNNSEQGFPVGGLVQASDGNLYGTTSGGNIGCGTISRVSPGGDFATLHVFGAPGGCNPGSALLQHTNGLLYGATNSGSASNWGVLFSFDVGLPQFVSLLPGASRVGQTVGIFGQGFTGTSAVSFNGTPASFNVDSDTYLTAVVPSGATTGSVTVTRPTGTLTSNKKFQVRPQVLSFSPASGPVGTTVVITGVSLGGATRVTFDGVDTPFTQNSDMQVTAQVPSGAQTGHVGVTTTGAPSYGHTVFTVTQ